MKRLEGATELSRACREAVTIPAGMQAELPSELRALAALIVNMLGRHTHEQRKAVLRFALEKEKFIPVNKTSVFSGTSLDPQRQIE